MLAIAGDVRLIYSTGEALFTWDALDHVEPSLSYASPASTGAGGSQSAPWDYFVSGSRQSRIIRLSSGSLRSKSLLLSAIAPMTVIAHQFGHERLEGQLPYFIAPLPCRVLCLQRFGRNHLDAQRHELILPEQVKTQPSSGNTMQGGLSKSNN